MTSLEITVEWSAGARRVAWGWRGVRVEKHFAAAPIAVAGWGDPVSVVVVEPFGAGGRLDNAVVFGVDGVERLRLVPPDVPVEPFRLLGFYAVYVSRGVLTAVFSTTVGDYWGVPDLRTGLVRVVGRWR
ncbi:hypothetical protein [Asanoa siamensis]|uniref:Uncharacterized protein n=1 Tax=Asanoa siamensis TaxID=926357 RepID=A0ABQ4CQ17_9ACTN|nr:hypothetical protein [Asanoa siamensis]GIF73384.1 hypothetical protein Asi02nite_29020 [Asanoa siamensis]